MVKAVAIQMASGPNVGANLIEAGKLINRAVEQGGKLIVLPENFAQMSASEADKLKIMEGFGSGKIQDFLSDLSARHGVWIVGGTVPIQSSVANKVRSACLVFNPQGQCAARYDKIHLFDVDIVATKEHYKESSHIEHGTDVVVLDTPFGKLGLAICYDLRFPELFRKMLDAGAEIFAVPSAFTAITGKAHWTTLVKARAIENLSYVIAAAQGGYHISGRETHGHSMIVDPWGLVLDELPRGSGMVIANIDREKLRSTREHFPAISHRTIK